MTDLLQHPLWRADDLGKPLPDSDYAVSVCIPQWRHVIGYEEKDPEVISRFRTGYPRFCCPPAIAALFEAAEREFAHPDERCLVFPAPVHARRCLDFIRHLENHEGRTETWTKEGLGVAIFPTAAYDSARRFWRYCGEVVSTREACEALGTAHFGVTKDEGAQASRIIRQRLAGLAGQSEGDVFLFPSGMGAAYAVHRMLSQVFPGRPTVQLDFPYVDVLKLQQVLGEGAHFFPLTRPEEYDEFEALAKRQSIAGIFCEAPSNPLLRCVDFERLRGILDRTQPDAPIVVDDTIGTVAHVDAFRVADVVTSSLTKAFSGKGDVLAGSVILNRRSRHYQAFAAFMQHQADHDLWRADAVALELNSRDFVERADRMSRNAQTLVEHLRTHPKVDRVWYASGDGGAGYELIRRPNGGYGCLFSVILKDGARTAPRFFDALEVCKGPSLGTDFTLACPFAMLAHYEELDWAESCGVDRNLVRISAGLEPVEELVARFDRALAVA